jgi:hypothetical protein
MQTDMRACVCCGQTGWLSGYGPGSRAVHWRGDRSHVWLRAYGAPKSGSTGVAGANEPLGDRGRLWMLPMCMSWAKQPFAKAHDPITGQHNV